jgi:hypothetical protein
MGPSVDVIESYGGDDSTLPLNVLGAAPAPSSVWASIRTKTG